MYQKDLLLIDDDEDDRLFFRDALAETFPGIRLIACADGEEAMSYLRSSPTRPDWIFLDLNMPRMNGVQFLKEFKSTGISTIPVIIYTTSYLQKDRELTEELGAVYFITKPTRITELQSEIRFVVEKAWH